MSNNPIPSFCVVGAEIEIEMGLSDFTGRPNGYPRYLSNYVKESAGWITARVVRTHHIEGQYGIATYYVTVEYKNPLNGFLQDWVFSEDSFDGLRPVQAKRCECGAAKCGTTHSLWCPVR
jgi:hypothetical protein